MKALSALQRFIGENTSQSARRWCGWLLLFAAIVALASLLEKSYIDPRHHKFILILGAIGSWRYANAALHYLRGMYFLHWRFPRMRRNIDAMGSSALPAEIFVVVTSFRIPAATSYKVYRAVFEEIQRLPVPSTVIASIVEKGDELLIKQLMRESVGNRQDIRLILVRTRGTGKRDALAHAFRALSRRMPTTNAVVAVVDGDTLLLPGCLGRAATLFAALPSVGGVTTNEFCKVEGGKLEKEWHSVRFAQRHLNMCSMALSKRVLTMTGRFSLFRAEVVTDAQFIGDVEADHLDHWRLGRFRFLTGDDKSSWFGLMRSGWDTFYAPDCHTLTVEHPPEGGFFRASRKLMFRWYGNSLRQNLRAIDLLGRRRLGAFASYVLYDQRISMWTCLLGLSASVAASLLYGFEYLLVYLFWVLISRTMVAILLRSTGHPIDPLYPFVLYYNQIVGSAMKVYALFHMDQQTWTRQKTTLNDATDFDNRLNRWTSKAMMLSSLAIFLGVVSVLMQLSQY